MNHRKPLARKRLPGLDRIDRAILAALSRDGRMTFKALAERVGLSARPCLERVRRLEGRGVIRGFAALLDPAAIGCDVVAFAEIALRDPSAAIRQRLERALAADPAVAELHIVTGEFDYIAHIAAASLTDYEALTAAYLSDPAFGIARISTTFVLKTVKPFDGYRIESSPN